ncbi:cytochrome P450 [Streptomyces sp. Wb2n-11]|uniref:cytochrome P450 n=1 Tax=Streptomyces sp. Wb2n-11 TaxID=1030533 RepID=UPI000B15520E|nr:cytochrome P450 [Streptomyces sp. Wb2n-11]
MPLAPGAATRLGHLVPLLRDPLGFLTSLAAVAPLVRVRLAHRELHVVTAPDLVHELLTTQSGACPRSGAQDIARRLFGPGILLTDGDERRAQRRTLQSCFTPGAVAPYIPVMCRVVNERIARWHPDRPVSMEHEMRALALDTVTESFFGTRLDPTSQRTFLTALPDMVTGLIVKALCPHPALGHLPRPVNRCFTASVRALRGTTEQIIRTAAPDPNGMITPAARSLPRKGRAPSSHGRTRTSRPVTTSRSPSSRPGRPARSPPPSGATPPSCRRAQRRRSGSAGPQALASRGRPPPAAGPWTRAAHERCQDAQRIRMWNPGDGYPADGMRRCPGPFLHAYCCMSQAVSSRRRGPHGPGW